MISENLFALSPVDGRYLSKTEVLRNYFSEYALIKYRVEVEIEYFISLCEIPLPQLKDFFKPDFGLLRDIYNEFNGEDAQRIKDIEKITNHDVKAVEYFIKEKFEKLNLSAYKEFIHFGLTSQDINNTAIPLSIKDCMNEVYSPALFEIVEIFDNLSNEWKDIPMLARTHGQPASPTRLGKEIQVFSARIKEQMTQLDQIPFSSKFGGATGNFNAHVISYPDIDWDNFGYHFVNNYLGLHRSFPTTQIEHYDNLAALLQCMARINNILTDFCRDIWTYISMDYFKQEIKKDEVGSSAMPHKVNPIDFENAEGNLGLAMAISGHLANKLPVSRLQRDLTDSTVLRNIGLPFAYTIIAFESIKKGVSKLLLNKEKIDADLDNNWMVIAEAIQTILRRENYPNPYETLKQLTRTNTKINHKVMTEFINSLNVSDAVKKELKSITPFNYTGL
ncbi:MAG: adenylosuccinate lyase [Bacteroidales bacterium]|nr:adenylosuccinate lyase [Bacteroidales bacterium]